MTNVIRAIVLCGVALSLMACEEDPEPMVAHIFYTACVGSQEGACSDNCCANQLDRSIGEEARIECEIRAGDLEGTYRLSFSADSPDAEGSPMIDADNLQFNQGASQPQPLRVPCDFLISEDGRDYAAQSCDSVDFGDSPGGGCQIQVHVNSESDVVGRFQCKELTLPGGPLFLSTVHGGNVGWGEFTIEQCNFRL
jgi:hypothetical protein